MYPYSPAHPWVPLLVLAAVLEGCPRPLLTPHLQQIADTLAQPDVCQEYQQVSSGRLGFACSLELLYLKMISIGP